MRIFAKYCTRALLLSAGILSCKLQPQDIQTVTPASVDSLKAVDSTVVLLDVRTKEEYDGELGHLRGAILIPVQELEVRIGELDSLKSRTIVVYCRSGGRSARATALLQSKGFHALNMEGGIKRWNADLRPVVREQRQEKGSKK